MPGPVNKLLSRYATASFDDRRIFFAGLNSVTFRRFPVELAGTKNAACPAHRFWCEASWRGASWPPRRRLDLRAGPALPGRIVPIVIWTPVLRDRPRGGHDVACRRWRGAAPVNRWQLQAGQLFNISQKCLLGTIAEGNRGARGAGPRGAVKIGFRDFGQFEVDGMGDAIDVDAARRDVGCDHGTGAAGAKASAPFGPGSCYHESRKPRSHGHRDAGRPYRRRVWFG
jgi:hypothetical protein